MPLAMKAAAKTKSSSSAPCRVCGEPRAGKGGKGMCQRCYAYSWRTGNEPSPERKKLSPGGWKNIQVHVELELAETAERAARRAGQTLPAWLRDVLREKLKR
jgi:hypothetical protein